MSQKNERLINLAIALIAAKRPITKEQIFKTVAGYSGNSESMDRMFERDKEDLKGLGIDISVKSIDPFFEDEFGYRITESDYQINLGELGPKEIGFLTLAAKTWDEISSDIDSQSIVRRLHSLGVAADLEIPQAKLSPTLLTTILTAIHQGQAISFDYYNEEDELEKRFLNPYAVNSNLGLWYLHGLDQKSKKIRTFRFDRIDGSINISTELFKKPTDFKIPEIVTKPIKAKIKIRRDHAQSLRMRSKTIEDLGDWEIAEVVFASPESAISEILWYGNDVVLLEPKEQRDEIVKALKTLVASHG